MDKEHILREIKRTAAAHGGVPLGHRRFYNETGIKANDWEKFWARWGDALRDAGFGPNQMQTAYDETLLMEKYIAVIREFRRFPTFRELRVKAHREPGFPNQKTFFKVGRQTSDCRQDQELLRWASRVR